MPSDTGETTEDTEPETWGGEEGEEEGEEGVEEGERVSGMLEERKWRVYGTTFLATGCSLTSSQPSPTLAATGATASLGHKVTVTGSSAHLASSTVSSRSCATACRAGTAAWAAPEPAAPSWARTLGGQEVGGAHRAPGEGEQQLVEPGLQVLGLQVLPQVTRPRPEVGGRQLAALGRPVGHLAQGGGGDPAHCAWHRGRTHIVGHGVPGLLEQLPRGRPPLAAGDSGGH